MEVLSDPRFSFGIRVSPVGTSSLLSALDPFAIVEETATQPPWGG
ncbi:hypothetical protein CIPAW_13G055200 [Carya illinoinensis]|uniref:Uncharacterized protein n=1 Tax=Carya illinoinensis TaxID=32201 RepID=A0A8T1NLX6_CARIL|nr:hypothetical protein CIPAW_13G055200 [Carya illinoinensis]